MKVYALPKQVPAPEIDYKNYDREKEQNAEEAHKEKLKAHLIALGYKGKHTGKIFASPYADGAALYMFADGPKSVLIHLPYGDAWNDPNVQYIPKKEILQRLAANEKINALFAAKSER